MQLSEAEEAKKAEREREVVSGNKTKSVEKWNNRGSDLNS